MAWLTRARVAFALLAALCAGVATLCAGSGPAAAAPVLWECQVVHSYDLAAAGEHVRRDASYIGDRFTADDGTGAVEGRNVGEPREWTISPRRFGPDQDGLQSLRRGADRLLMHLYVETFAPGPTKPFVISELDIGASRTGTCRARP